MESKKYDINSRDERNLELGSLTWYTYVIIHIGG